MKSTALSKPGLRSACDRCYELKERCQREAPAAACARCRRLGITCSNARPVRPAGRRVRQRKATATLEPYEARRGEVKTNTDIQKVISDLPPEEQDLMLFLWNQPESLDPIIVCSSFHKEQQDALLSQLSVGFPLLKDAYLALAVTLQQLQSGVVVEQGSRANLAYISKAVGVLRSLAGFHSPQNVALCYTLGAVLSLAISSAVGVGIPDICRACLGGPSSSGRDPAPDENKSSWESLLILLETMDSLMWQRKPARKFPATTAHIDRHLGLCLPLLPYYHDLCQISNAILNTKHATALNRMQGQLDDIRAAVEIWQPTQSAHLVDRFTSTEVVILLAQAKVYRLGALLLSHRIRHSLGQRDAEATAWSKELIFELDLASRVTKQTPRFVTLPFIIAAVEVQGDAQRVKTLQHVDDFVDSYALFMKQAIKTFLLRVWHERDTKRINSWFESVHKPCPVLNYMDETIFDPRQAIAS